MTQKNVFETMKRSTAFHLFFLIVVSLLLRLYRFRNGEIITSSDEIYLYEYSLKPVYGLLSGSLSVLATESFRFFNFPWGWGMLLWSSLFVFLLNILKIPLTEVTINFPYVIVGTLSILCSYTVAREVGGRKYAFIVALFIALLPSHIAYSRSIGVNGIVGLFFFLMTLLFFIKYQKTMEQKYLIWTYVFLALYFVSDNQALGILPLLFLTSYLYSPKENFLEKLSDAAKRCFCWRGIVYALLLLFPTIVAAIYLAQKGLIKNSYLNIFHSKPIIPGLYVQETIATIVYNAGIMLTLIVIIGFFFYLYLLVRKRATKESMIIFSWFLIYALPWFFLVPPKIVDVRVYNTPVICSLIFLTGYLFIALEQKIAKREQKKERMIGYAILGLFLFGIISGMLLTTTKSVYNYDIPGVYAPMQKFGAVGENNGIKTIGFYVREQTSSDAVFFVDVESFTAQYYFHRRISGSLDLTAEETLLLFERTNATNISYVFIQAKNKEIFDAILKERGFTPLLFAVEDEKIKSILYGKEQQSIQEQKTSVQMLDIKEYDELFNKKYGSVEDLFVEVMN